MTVVSVAPVTVAVKNCVVPGDKVMEFGVTVTFMVAEGAGVGVEG